MEFWPENPGQSPLYSKFSTVPRRNSAHNYHNRHQEPHYPLYYGEQQDQGRETSYWTIPGSRTGGAPQEYTSWTDQELTAPTASHFPFILDRHAQQHQDLGHYQLHRDREWTAAPQAAREYERGFLREGWQRRWEPCGPVRYNREVSAKRSDSSYRELEAWAARYSHSLPRRRRLEAELRGGSQALLESSRAPERDGKSGMDPRMAALQQVRQSANIRESGLWGRGSRQKAPAYCPSQTPATNTSHMMDMKEKTSYQWRMFSQPPGYIAPPPYDSPHKGSPVLHHSWEQEGKRQPYWLKLRDQDVSVDLDHREGEKNEFTKPDGNQKSSPEIEGREHRRQETDDLQAFSIQEAHGQPQVLQAVENKKINEEPSSKIIEGRKFRLNKKNGGLTIFCLVSRIAGTAETQSLPLCTLQTNNENIELGDLSKGLRGINQMHKLADEVDFRAPTLTEQSNISGARNVKEKQETPACVESEMLGDNNKAETEKVNANDAHPTCGRQVAQSVKYPLWREPGITSRTETESSSAWLKANSDERETDALHNPESEVHPIDVEERRLDMETDTEPVDSKGLLLIDTTRVVVKMELIPSPKKEHVHYLHGEHSPLDIQSTVAPKLISQDVTADQSTESNSLHSNETHDNKPDLERMGEMTPEGESEISSLCVSSCSVPEGEMLEERAERILGIPLNEPITEQPPADETSLLALCVQNQQVEPSPIKDNDTDYAAEQIQREGEQSQNELEVCSTEEAVCLQESDDTKDQAANEGGGGFAGANIKLSTEIGNFEDPVLKPTSEEGKNEQEENDSSSHHCLSPPTNLSTHPSLSPPPDCEAPDPAFSLMLSSSDLTPLMYFSESNIEEGPDPELIVLNSRENPAPHPETSFPPPGFTDSTPSSTPHPDHSPSPSPLDLTDRTTEAVSDVEEQDEEDETPQLINNEITDILEDLSKDMTEELVSQQQFESGQTDNVAFTSESNVTDEQQIKETDPTDHLMEQTPEKSKEDVIDVDILQQQLECVQAEDVIGVKKSYITEEQLPKDVTEDALDLRTSQENSTQMKVNILQHESDNGQEEDASLRESYMTQDRSQNEPDEDPAGQLEQTLATENATDSQTQLEILQDVEPQIGPSSPPSPSDSDCEESPLDAFPSPPHESNEPDSEFISLLEMDSVCSSALSPDAAPAAVPFHLDSCEESPQFSSSSCADSPLVLPPSSSTPPPQERDRSIDTDLSLKEEPQCPKSLWDVVNRIRKHTAPDSENEEEEVTELWDPESLGEDLSHTDVVVDIHSGRIIFDGAGQQEDSSEGSVEDVDVGNFLLAPCHEEPSRQAEEEDTLSCSSTSSHSSGDTVIVADEEEEISPDARTEGKTEDEEEFQTAEEERSCSAGVKDETAAEEERDNDGEGITNESSQSEECPVEAVEKTETEEEVFMESDEGMIEIEPLK